jgi:hypothetical protein
MTSLETGLRDFAQFAAKLKGGEKSEAQTFLFHLLAAFGHGANTLPEGSTFEYRVRFPGQHTKFADFVWPGRCLIEMKSRGVKLSKHYQQTFDYWLSPARAGRYAGVDYFNGGLFATLAVARCRLMFIDCEGID